MIDTIECLALFKKLKTQAKRQEALFDKSKKELRSIKSQLTSLLDKAIYNSTDFGLIHDEIEHLDFIINHE